MRTEWPNGSLRLSNMSKPTAKVSGWELPSGVAVRTQRSQRVSGIPRHARRSFWRAVEDCLIEFHHLKKAVARAQCVDLRARIDHPPPGLSDEAIYHAEPFDVACNLAGKDLNLAQYRGPYDQILQRHNW